MTILTALALAAGLASGAAAAPPSAKACDLMVDTDGDGNLGITRPVFNPANQSSPALEILGGEVASGANTVVAQLKVKSTTLGPSDPQTINGVRWALNFKIGNTPYSVMMEKRSASDAGTATFYADRVAVSDGIKSTKIDGQTITWVVDRKKFVILTKKKDQKFTTIAGSTSGNMGSWFGADDGSSQKVYVDKQKHCRLAPS